MLYPPVRNFLQGQGFTVHAEAKHCDVVGQRGDEVVVVELKRAFTLELLAQGIERQKLTDVVYVAIPKPETSVVFNRVRSFFPILRKLELGLLSVDIKDGHVAMLVQPLPFQRRRQPRARRALLTELSGRSGDDNIGGSTRIKIVTAYRESAVFVAVALQKFGPQSPKALRKIGTGDKTPSILSGNFYDWFIRVDRGIYGLTAKGIAGLESWKTLAERKRALLPEKIEPKAAKVAKILI